MKQVASHYGGTAQGVAMSWPGHINDVGGIRRQFHHVIDIAATVLDAAMLPQPTFVNGVQQTPLHGTSMTYSFDDAAAADEIFSVLMGEDVESRRSFIQRNARDVRFLDI